MSICLTVVIVEMVKGPPGYMKLKARTGNWYINIDLYVYKNKENHIFLYIDWGMATRMTFIREEIPNESFTWHCFVCQSQCTKYRILATFVQTNVHTSLCAFFSAEDAGIQTGRMGHGSFGQSRGLFWYIVEKNEKWWWEKWCTCPTSNANMKSFYILCLSLCAVFRWASTRNMGRIALTSPLSKQDQIQNNKAQWPNMPVAIKTLAIALCINHSSNASVISWYDRRRKKAFC